LTFVERSEIVVHTKSGTAVVSSRWKGKGTWKEGEINDDQRCGQVFIKDKKTWKLLAEHCVQIASK
jgi:ketosteroid isomerase-like protein